MKSVVCVVRLVSVHPSIPVGRTGPPKKTKENCIIQTCTGIDLHYSTTISGDELTELGFDIPNIIPTTVPLCKHHYILDHAPTAT